MTDLCLHGFWECRWIKNGLDPMLTQLHTPTLTHTHTHTYSLECLHTLSHTRNTLEMEKREEKINFLFNLWPRLGFFMAELLLEAPQPTLSDCLLIKSCRRYFFSEMLWNKVAQDSLLKYHFGPWWWSSGQRPRLLLQWSEFDPCAGYLICTIRQK